MRSPSIVPGFDVDVYLVLDDFGKIGRSYRETDEGKADRETIIRNLLGGQYNNPVRIIAFNTAEGWSRDVCEDIARDIKDRADREPLELSEGLRKAPPQLASPCNKGPWSAQAACSASGGPVRQRVPNQVLVSD